MGVPQNRLFIREHAIKIDDLGVPPFSETTKSKTYPQAKLIKKNTGFLKLWGYLQIIQVIRQF